MATFEIRLKHRCFAAWTSSHSDTDGMTYLLAGLLSAGSGRRSHLQRQRSRLPTCDKLLSVISNEFVLIIITAQEAIVN